MPNYASDAVASVLHTALDGIALRQRVVADNVANIDTPGFHASRVDFEASLRAAIADGSIASGSADGAVSAAVVLAPTPLGPNQNNVDLQTETMTAMQAQFQYQMLTRAVSDRHALMRTVLGAS